MASRSAQIRSREKFIAEGKKNTHFLKIIPEAYRGIVLFFDHWVRADVNYVEDVWADGNIFPFEQ